MKNIYSKTIQLRRVVITGMGIVSPLGINVEQNWQNLINGKSGIIRIKDLDEIKDDERYPDVYMGKMCSDFNPENWKVAFTNNNLNKFTLAATDEAIKDSNLIFLEKDLDESEDVYKNLKEINYNTGVNIGAMNSNITKLTEIIGEATLKGFNKLNRMTIMHVLSNMPSANVSIKYKLLGPQASSAAACATGAQSIGESFRLIQLGKSKVMIAGGSEDSFGLTSIHSSIKMQAMNTKKFDNPSQSSRPFDKKRSGFILSEGSGVLVLEDLEHALNRNAKIYAEISGYGCTSDGYHLTRPLESGNGALRAMKEAISDSDLQQLEQISQINCHSTSTSVGDIAEANAIRDLFGQGKQVITAYKSSLGHTFGAAGAIETILAIKSLKEDLCPPLLNLEDSSDMPKLNFAQKETIQAKQNYILKNSFGFGGVNCSLLLKKFQI